MQDTAQLQHVITQAPKGATHYVLENGTHYYFLILGLNAKIWGNGEWVEYEACCLPDLQNVQLLADIRYQLQLLEQVNSAQEQVEKAVNGLKIIARIANDNNITKLANSTQVDVIKLQIAQQACDFKQLSDAIKSKEHSLSAS